MSDIAIKIENLSKMYRLGVHTGGVTFREALVSAARFPFRMLGGRAGADKKTNNIWALKDVSLEIERGDVVGVIGRNGAGKSTLLKILSRITEPTSGRVELHGRVGSLLEVGTGFHPELTGHENIYLYGAILGMDRYEVTRKFDEIVAFAELDSFIDTPVKRYSSGMYMRLAFAVAAHLETEILLVDEVLAVGDAVFQKKCLGKMGEVANQGRTVLFVSHNMGAVKSLCKKAVIIESGSVSHAGPSGEAIQRYMSSVLDTTEGLEARVDVSSHKRTKATDDARIAEISLKNQAGELQASFEIWEPVTVELLVRAPGLPVTVSPWMLFYGASGLVVLSAFHYDSMPHVTMEKSPMVFRAVLDPNPLAPGLYSMSAGVFGKHNEFFDWLDEAIVLEIKEQFHTGKAFDKRLGQTTLPYSWEVTDKEGGP